MGEDGRRGRGRGHRSLALVFQTLRPFMLHSSAFGFLDTCNILVERLLFGRRRRLRRRLRCLSPLPFDLCATVDELHNSNEPLDQI